MINDILNTIAHTDFRCLKYAKNVIKQPFDLMAVNYYLKNCKKKYLQITSNTFHKYILQRQVHKI